MPKTFQVSHAKDHSGVPCQRPVRCPMPKTIQVSHSQDLSGVLCLDKVCFQVCSQQKQTRTALMTALPKLQQPKCMWLSGLRSCLSNMLQPSCRPRWSLSGEHLCYNPLRPIHDCRAATRVSMQTLSRSLWSSVHSVEASCSSGRCLSNKLKGAIQAMVDFDW